MTTYRQALGERLRDLRKWLNEMQVQFEARLGVTQLSVLRYEAGVTCPTGESLSRLAASGADLGHVIFGVPSLALPASRRRFAAAYAWMNVVRSERGMGLDEEILVEASWLMFKKLYGADEGSALSPLVMHECAQEALETVVSAIAG